MSTEEKMEVDNRSIYVGNVSDNMSFIIIIIIIIYIVPPISVS
jgi:hypothetical protein